MRAALYASTTAADLGRSGAEDILPELRRYAELQGWEVVAEQVDVCPAGSGKRPGYEQIEQLVAAGAVDVVVTDSLHRIFRDFAHFARLAPAWVEKGLALVCTQQGFDATTPAGWARLLAGVTLVAEWQQARYRERQRIGYLRARAAADGDHTFGRPRIGVNPLEVKTLYERGLSNTEMIAKVVKAGGRLSKGTLWRELDRQRALGLLDEAARAKAIAERGGPDRGGRRLPPGKPLTPAVVAELFASGAGKLRMHKILRAAGYRVSKGILLDFLEGLDRQGMLDHEARARAIEERKAPKKQAA